MVVASGPENARGAAQWPAWFAPAGFLIAFGVTLLLGTTIAAVGIVAGADPDGDSPAITAIATLVRDLVLIGTALALAARVSGPTLADFGLRPVPAARAIARTAVAIAVFYVLSALYAAIVRPRGEQDVLEDLGADRGTGYLVVSAAIIIGLAPIAEEIFFRGFMFRALRNRLSAVAAAAVVGLVSGSIRVPSVRRWCLVVT